MTAVISYIAYGMAADKYDEHEDFKRNEDETNDGQVKHLVKLIYFVLLSLLECFYINMGHWVSALVYDFKLKSNVKVGLKTLFHFQGTCDQYRANDDPAESSATVTASTRECYKFFFINATTTTRTCTYDATTT